MRVLLINPMPQGGIVTPFPVLPLGLACIAAVAWNRQTDVHIISGSQYQKQLIDYLKKFKPDIVGFQTFVNNFDLCISSSSEIKKNSPDSVIVLGGVEVSNDPEKAFTSPFIDCVITGEGERVFSHLLDHFQDDFKSIPGLIWQDDMGRIRHNPGGGVVEKLDDLPPIPYHLFYGNKPTPVGHILTHRGCPHHCSHCPLKFRAGIPIRSHSAEYIVKTIQALKMTHHISEIEFFDENFTLHPDFVYHLCQSLESASITWRCTARVSEMDENLALQMYRGGCRKIIFGLGTGVPRLQKVLGTDEDLDKAREIFSFLTKIGIQPVAVFSLGIPTETRSEFKETVKYALSLKARDIRFEPCAPIPGTQLHELAQSGGRFLISSWSEYLHPGQIVYLPAGWRKSEFQVSLYTAKVLARVKNYIFN